MSIVFSMSVPELELSSNEQTFDSKKMSVMTSSTRASLTPSLSMSTVEDFGDDSPTPISAYTPSVVMDIPELPYGKLSARTLSAVGSTYAPSESCCSSTRWADVVDDDDEDVDVLDSVSDQQESLFNLSDFESVEQEVAAAVDELENDEAEHELATPWAYWEQVGQEKKETFAGEHYNSLLRKVTTVDTIESFMKVFNGLPKAAEMLPQEIELARNGEAVKAFGFFRDSVKPTFDDATLKTGGMFHYNFKGNFPADALEEIWQRLLFTVVGDSSEMADKIMGVRVTKTTKASCALRFEVWHSELGEEGPFALRTTVTSLLKEELTCGGCAVTASKLGSMRTNFDYSQKTE